MSIEIIKGNIWNTKCQTLVNTVNCEGVMGAGIALEARLRYPQMFQKYKEYCQQGLMKIGYLMLYKNSEPYWILNFPTKNKWKLPSKEQYIIDGLHKFIDTYEQKSIESIAFPVLGGLNGGLDESRVIDIMQSLLCYLPIKVEIYQYSPTSSDDFFNEFKKLLINSDIDLMANQMKIRKNYLETLHHELINNSNIYQVNQLLKIKGIGEATLEKIFAYQKMLKSGGQIGLF